MNGRRRLPSVAVRTSWSRTQSAKESPWRNSMATIEAGKETISTESFSASSRKTRTRRQLLERGEADAAASNLTIDALEALRNDPAVQVMEYPTAAVTWAIMNAPRLLSKEVRQGFSYAFPYDDVLNVVYKGPAQDDPARSPIACAATTRTFSSIRPTSTRRKS